MYKRAQSIVEPAVFIFAAIALILVFLVFTVLFNEGLDERDFHFEVEAASSDLAQDIQLNNYLGTPVEYEGTTISMRQLIKRMVAESTQGGGGRARERFANKTSDILNLAEHLYKKGHKHDDYRCRQVYALSVYREGFSSLPNHFLKGRGIVESGGTVDLTRDFERQELVTITSDNVGGVRKRNLCLDMNAGHIFKDTRNFAHGTRVITLPDGRKATVQISSMLQNEK